MQLTGKNSRYDAGSGAIIVQQSDEMKLLMQISQRLGTMESKLDALLEQRSATNNGTDMGKQ